MNRDDHLFAIIGGTVVTAAATIFLVFAGGITGTIEDRPPIRVAPIPVAETSQAPADIVPAGFDEPMPSLGDDFVRSLAGGISAHPGWASWLVTDNLLSRFVTAVEAVADGYSPRSELGFVATSRPFLVREDEGRLVIAAGTYRRFDLAVEVFSSLDAEDAVAIYEELEPAILAARRDVAWHRGDFEDRLRQAIDHLLEVKIPGGAIEVERRRLTYAFAEDDLERLSDAQRQLLRMGRENAIAVQAKLRDIRMAFDWPTVQSAAAVRHAVISNEDVEPSDPVVIAEAVVDDLGPDTPAQATGLGPVVESAMTPIDTPIWGMSPSIPTAAEHSPAPAE